MALLTLSEKGGVALLVSESAHSDYNCEVFRDCCEAAVLFEEIFFLNYCFFLLISSLFLYLLQQEIINYEYIHDIFIT